MSIRVALYPGFIQNDQYCFQKLAMHCVVKFLEYFFGNERSSVPGAGMQRSFMSSCFILCNYIYWNKKVEQLYFNVVALGKKTGFDKFPFFNSF